MKKDLYTQLHEISKTATLLNSTSNLLQWDQETYMPPEGIGLRSLQIEQLASLVHKQKTGGAFSKALGKLINIETGEIYDASLSPAQMAALREWRKDYIRDKKLPTAFVKKFAQTTSSGVFAWTQAKRHNSFKEFAPHLEKIISLSRKKADLLGFKEHPYDALLDLFEPEMTVAYLSPLFTSLKLSLTTLLQEIAVCPPVPVDCLHGDFPLAKQMHFSHRLLEAMGMVKDISNLSLTMHPFCSGLHPKDTRLTTFVNPEFLPACLFGVLHEGGHGLYNAGLPPQHFGSPLCESLSLGIDESQSRWWEILIGHSLPFWQHFYPQLQNEFPEKLSSVPLDEYYEAINTVKPSLIRVQADAVTYSLHVILRFELEKALIEGSLKVKEVPEAWNEKMREYLGIVPIGASDGCLQDIHWAMGLVGYFPTYTLGNLYSAQFFTAFEKTHPEWKEKVAKGDLAFIRQWLHDNIYRYGRQFSAEELCTRITGSPVTAQPYVNYLEQKFKALYRLPERI